MYFSVENKARVFRWFYITYTLLVLILCIRIYDKMSKQIVQGCLTYDLLYQQSIIHGLVIDFPLAFMSISERCIYCYKRLIEILLW